VGDCRGGPDYFALMGSALQYYRTRVEDFPCAKFLEPDPVRVAQYRAQLETLCPGSYVGICWRSMMLGPKRNRYYSALDEWGPILKTPGVTFVNIQYGDCQAELARAEEQHGVKIYVIPGLDLKDDIDGGAACPRRSISSSPRPPRLRRPLLLWERKSGSSRRAAPGRNRARTPIPGIAKPTFSVPRNSATGKP
jgi:hypothetical protein